MTGSGMEDPAAEGGASATGASATAAEESVPAAAENATAAEESMPAAAENATAAEESVPAAAENATAAEESVPAAESPDPAFDPAEHPGEAGPGHWNAVTGPFKGPDLRRSVTQLTLTALAFFGLWYLMYRSLEVGYVWTLLLAIPTGGFLIRLFMIQHDCGHGSYFRSRTARDAVGFVIGVLTLIPYQYWRRTHAHHHAHNGDLDFRGFGDVETKTVAEYRALSPLQRLGYRLYRHPVVLLGIGPLWHFVIKHRYPWDVPRDWTQAWRSIWWTNAGVAVLWGGMILLIGWKAFVLVHLPVVALTCSTGVWLFYVQHQYDEAYWQWHEEWDYFDAALHGSSHLALPKPLAWLTAWIGLHHVHHLSALIPNYRLKECLEASPDLQGAQRFRIRDTWRLFGLSLWDEESGRLVGFREEARTRAEGAEGAETGA